ncbi:MAG: HAD family hydrolase [Ardenticatenaceae bacterium]
MSFALLLDLDDTLLHNSMKDFLPNYFRALMAAVVDDVAPEPFLDALRYATRQMMTNTDPLITNQGVFWEAFTPRLGADRERLEWVLNRFYEESFPALASTTAPMAGAQALIDAAKGAGWQVVVATNPIFPRLAIEHRIRWAQLDESAFDLITSYENMTSTKPHSSYYSQIADMLGVPTQNCVMAGNHLSNDIVGAAAVGMKTFWVRTYPIADADMVPDEQGSLVDLHGWLFGD